MAHGYFEKQLLEVEQWLRRSQQAEDDDCNFAVSLISFTFESLYPVLSRMDGQLVCLYDEFGLFLQQMDMYRKVTNAYRLLRELSHFIRVHPPIERWSCLFIMGRASSVALSKRSTQLNLPGLQWAVIGRQEFVLLCLPPLNLFVAGKDHPIFAIRESKRWFRRSFLGSDGQTIVHVFYRVSKRTIDPKIFKSPDSDAGNAET